MATMDRMNLCFTLIHTIIDLLIEINLPLKQFIQSILYMT